MAFNIAPVNFNQMSLKFKRPDNYERPQNNIKKVSFASSPYELTKVDNELLKGLSLLGLNAQQMQPLDKAKKLVQLATKDKLTGLNNRAAFDAYFVKAVNESISNNVPLKLAMIDIDCFKGVNDVLGHDTGDVILKETGKVINEAVGEDNPNLKAFRYGGEEIILVFKKNEAKSALEKLKEISEKFSNNSNIQGYQDEYKDKLFNLETSDSTKWKEHWNNHKKFTVSAGLVDFEEVKHVIRRSNISESFKSLSQEQRDNFYKGNIYYVGKELYPELRKASLYKAMDGALYVSKENGRGQIIQAGKAIGAGVLERSVQAALKDQLEGKGS